MRDAWAGQRARHSLRGEIKPWALVLKYIWEVPKYVSIFCLTSDSPPLSMMKPADQVEDTCGVDVVPGAGHHSVAEARKEEGRKASLFLLPHLVAL